MLTRPVSRRASLLIALAATSPWAVAQNTAQPAALAWPTKPLKIIVGFPAGTSPDLTARAFSEPLSKALGQPVIVDNRVGAGGNIGADAVAKAHDDHTIGLMINGNMTIARMINPAVP
jgi:tripartite-type tricarboxylate transporter receptor subunit TctC